jgi:hypothetical protein
LLSVSEKKLFSLLQLRCEIAAELEEQMTLELQTKLNEEHKRTISEIKKKQWVCILLAYARAVLGKEC